MNKKIALTVFASMCIILFLAQFNAPVVAVPRKPLVPHDLTFVEGKSVSDVDNPEDSIAKVASNTVILNQGFEDEQVGDVPRNWTITRPQYGSFTVDNQTCYSGHKSAKFVDNSTVGSPCPYKAFPPQNGTVAVKFAIRLNASSGINTNLSIWVDDGNFTGANVYFTNKSTIEYHDDGFHTLCSYTGKQWYRIKIVMNIPNNLYEIYIDDVRIIKNAKFHNFNVSHEIRRIAFGEALDLQPIGHIDNIMVTRIRSIQVPEDYPTIQDAIDMASAETTIHVASDRSYYEHICIQNKHDLWLKGENRSTTVINGTFEGVEDVISIDQYSYNITISGFTIGNGWGGIFIDGSNNTITDNIITLDGYGIHVESQYNTITNNIISNNKIGVNCTADKGNTFHHNRFICNEHQAFDHGSSNTWNNTAQGNYWSDYTGKDEDGDGIGNTPYDIIENSKDYHPLFLIQTVSRSLKEPSYNENVTITVTTLENVQIDKVILNFTCDSTWGSIDMTPSDRKWNATIPPQEYGTTVRYKIHARARATCSFCAVSAIFSYTVTDRVPPEIHDVERTPKDPYSNQTVTIIANVSEPEKASGVDEVYLYHNVDNSSWWRANMTYNATSGKCNATIPNYQAGANVTYYVEAFDRAGYNNASDWDWYTVKPLPEPKLCIENDALDFGTIGEGTTETLTFKIENCGKGTLTWEITIKRGASWLNVTPASGKLASGKTENIKVTVNATCMGLYLGELLATSNGGNKTLPVYVLVTRIIIDNTMVSDDHCDIGYNQTIYFHAIWANNRSAVQNCTLNITCTDYTTNATDWAIHTTNATGWVSFTNSSLMMGKRIWMVTGVDCGGVTSYIQQAPNPSIIWDKIKITHGGPPNGTQTYVTQTETVWFQAEYEYDNATFDGTKGKLYVNGSAMTWSSSYSRWECNYSFDTAGTRTFKVSGLPDTQHGLTVINDEVGALSISWVEKVPFWTEWAFFMMVAVVAAIGGGIFSTLAFWTLRVYKKKS